MSERRPPKREGRPRPPGHGPRGNGPGRPRPEGGPRPPRREAQGASERRPPRPNGGSDARRPGPPRPPRPHGGSDSRRPGPPRPNGAGEGRRPASSPRPAQYARPQRGGGDDDEAPGAGGAERLQKVLAHAGLGSRRACEEFMLQGRVTINGQVIRELGTKVVPGRDRVAVDGQSIQDERPAYIAVNKPKGYVSTNKDPSGRPRVVDLVPNIPQRVYTVGRLDEMSTGLMLLTNDGDLANKLAHPKFGVEKVYRAVVAGTPAPEVYQKLVEGVWLAEGKVRAQRVRPVAHKGDATVLEMVLAEGKNREVRRMLAKLGHKVMTLTRVAVGPVTLKGLKPGGWRFLTANEVELLRRVADGLPVSLPRSVHDRPMRAPTRGPAARSAGLRPSQSSGAPSDRPRPTGMGDRRPAPAQGQDRRPPRREDGPRPPYQSSGGYGGQRPQGPGRDSGPPQRPPGRPSNQGPPQRPSPARPRISDQPPARQIIGLERPAGPPPSARRPPQGNLGPRPPYQPSEGGEQRPPFRPSGGGGPRPPYQPTEGGQQRPPFRPSGGGQRPGGPGRDSGPPQRPPGRPGYSGQGQARRPPPRPQQNEGPPPRKIIGMGGGDGPPSQGRRQPPHQSSPPPARRPLRRPGIPPRRRPGQGDDASE